MDFLGVMHFLRLMGIYWRDMLNVKMLRRLVKYKRHGWHDWRENGSKVERTKLGKMSGLEVIQIDGTILRMKMRKKKKVKLTRRKKKAKLSTTTTVKEVKTRQQREPFIK